MHHRAQGRAEGMPLFFKKAGRLLMAISELTELLEANCVGSARAIAARVCLIGFSGSLSETTVSVRGGDISMSLSGGKRVGIFFIDSELLTVSVL